MSSLTPHPARLAALAGISLATLSAANAADITKANNAESLNTAASWLGGVVPGVLDTAVFDGTVDTGGADFYMPLSAAWDVNGIRITGNQTGMFVDTFNTGGSGVQLTLGAGGIDMSTGTPGTVFTFDNPTLILRAGTSPAIKAGAGTSLILKGPVQRANGAGARFSMGADNTGIIQVEDTTWGTGLISHSTVAFSGADDNTSDAFNFQVDFADISTASGQRRIVPSRTVRTYVSNPNTGASLPNIGNGADGAILDVVNSNTVATATAYRVTANMGMVGIRFDVPHATGLDWIVDTSTTTRNLNIGTRGLIVGPSVGAKNVIYNGSSWWRLGTGQDFFVHQLNPAGNLIFNIGMTQSSGTGSRLVKTGPGRLILTSNNNSLGGTTTIVEGTIQVGNNTASGSINGGAIVNHGTLAFNRTDGWTLSNAISGTGQVSNLGTGTVTLGGANTFTGPVNLNGGNLAFTTLGNLGSGTALNFNGGALLWNAGSTEDISVRTVNLLASGGGLNVGANNVTLANPIGNGGAGGLTKSGSGALTLAAANNYSGPTNVAAGTLVVTNASGSATGSGNVSVAGGATLAGTGSLAGVVSTTTGSIIQPGVSGVGTLTVGGLTLASGSITEIEVANVSSYDSIVTTQPNALTVNGGGLRLYNAGTTLPLTTEGLFNIAQFSGSVQGTGPNALTVLNPQAGYAYTFGTSGSFLTLNVELDAILSQWAVNASGSWASGSNWSNGVPTTGYTAQFTTNLGAPAFVTLDGARTINGAVFDSAESYSLTPGTGGSLTLDKGVKTVAINVLQGAHFISVPTLFSSDVGVTTSAGTSLTFTDVISGAGDLIKDGAGTLDLQAANTFSGDISAVLGTLAFSQASSLGSGALTLNGATLRYNAGNTADISSRAITFGLNGATIDTGANNVAFANAVGAGSPGAFTKSGSGTLTLVGGLQHQGSTTIAGGMIAVGANEAIGPSILNQALVLNGGGFTPTQTLTLSDGGTNLRPISVLAGGGSLDVPEGATLTVPGLVSGSGALAKRGAGDLTVLGNNAATFSGPVTIESGAVRLGNDRAIGQTGLGSGSITLNNGTTLFMNGVGTTDNGNGFGTLSNALVIPAGANVSVRMPQRGIVSGAATGSGTLNLYVDGTRSEVSGNWPAFTGQLIVRPTGSGTAEYRPLTGQNMVGARVHLSSGVIYQQPFNPPTGSGTETVHTYGELTADAGAILGGNPVGGRFNNYTVGALNTDFAIHGQFRGQLNTFGYGYPRLTKNGTGTLTLTNSHLTTGSVTVNGGTLRVLGNIEQFYTGAGVDLNYGRFPADTGTCDDTISLTPPAGDFQITQPGPVNVNASGTLAGNGRLGGVTTINGTLRPDATGTLGGQLSFTNEATLTLGLASTTQFDINGMIFTGVKVDRVDGLVYGGALRLNFLGQLYNGSYQLFQFNGTAGSAFSTVLVNTLITTDAPLADSSGVWTGTVDGASVTFNASTGVLTIADAGTPVLPAAPSSLAALAGDGVVDLTWTAGAATDSFRVFRGTTAGGPYTLLASGVLPTSYADTTVANGTTYFYVVQGANTIAYSGNSNEVSASPAVVLPAAPSGLGATGGNAVVNLSWTGGANTVSFTVLRSTTAGGPYTSIASGVLTTTYADNTAVNGTTYYYVVQGVNGSGSSAVSNEASATPSNPYTGLELWRITHFGVPDNSGAGADDADPDGDGVVNLMEYATGTLPLSAASKAPPVLGTSGSSLTLTFNRIADPLLTYVVRPSADVATAWSLGAVFTSTGVDNVAGPVVATDPTAVSGCRFLRLEVTYSAP